jgi:hypothetical protein
MDSPAVAVFLESLILCVTNDFTKDNMARTAGVNIRALFHEVGGGPGIIDENWRSTANPDCDQRILDSIPRMRSTVLLSGVAARCQWSAMGRDRAAGSAAENSSVVDDNDNNEQAQQAY